MIREIYLYGDPLLRQKAAEVKSSDKSLKALVEDMIETMVAARGIGLAAPQIGVSKRVLVVDLKQGAKTRLVVLNPKLDLSGPREAIVEGCLSIPKIWAEVRRPGHVRVEGLDMDGHKIILEADGLFGRVFQHEVDHLDGIFFVDRLSSVRRALLAGKLKRLEKDHTLRKKPDPSVHEESESAL